MSQFCSTCNVLLKSKICFRAHVKSKRHIDRARSPIANGFVCVGCRKSYATRQSLHVHKKSCKVESIPVCSAPFTLETFDDLKNTVLEDRKKHKLERDEYLKERNEYLKERDELRSQIALLLDKQSQTATHTNFHNQTNTNNIETQNITININAFGDETTEYIDDKTILACIGRVYNSIPSLLEKIHFDPKHPENHNIKITNRKLPYASVMGNNQKWKTVDRKNAIDTMVNNSYNMLDDKFKENKDKISASKQEHFRGFQSKFDAEDKELMKEIKAEVDMMVLNGV